MNFMNDSPSRYPFREDIGLPDLDIAAIKVAAIAPALVPATRGKEYPASARTDTAPTMAIPLTPPPSSARSATNCLGPLADQPSLLRSISAASTNACCNFGG